MLDEDLYVERRNAFLGAALPSGEVGVEYTFDMFLIDFVGVYEKRLQNKISKTGSIALHDASLQEMNEAHGDRQEFNKFMDFLFEEVPPDDNVTAVQLISEAYNALHDRRRIRYNRILDNLSTTDRAVIQSEYFDKLLIDIGPLPAHPRHYRFSLAIEFPNEDPNRIERQWTYLLARGLPVKKAQKTSCHGGVISFSSGAPSNGY